MNTVTSPTVGTVHDSVVQNTLAVLDATPHGKLVSSGLRSSNAPIIVMTDSDFESKFHSPLAYAMYEPKDKSIYMRRTTLEADPRFAAVALAHEGTHYLDDVSGIESTAIQRAIDSINLLEKDRQNDATKQKQWEISMIGEARAFVVSGHVARELGAKLENSDVSAIAAKSVNEPDSTIYAKVWQRLLESNYNPEHRMAPPQHF